MSSAGNKAVWQMVRLRRETVASLRRFLQSYDVAYNRGQVEEGPGEQGYSLDFAVVQLLLREGRHRWRSMKSGRTRKLRRLAAKQGLGVITPDEGGGEPCTTDQ